MGARYSRFARCGVASGGEVRLLARFIDPDAAVHAIVKPLVGDVKVYYHGPLPDFGDRMVVYQVVAPRPVGGDGLTFEAVRANVMFQVFDRDRVKGMALAHMVCQGVFEKARSRIPVRVADGEEYVFPFARVDEVPTQVNANLVNDRLAYRFDFEIELIVRREYGRTVDPVPTVGAG